MYYMEKTSPEERICLVKKITWMRVSDDPKNPAKARNVALHPEEVPSPPASASGPGAGSGRARAPAPLSV